ncbi:Dam family site-specific DNA-(adenine-N6)-methyltransferase [Rahnella aquatilis]|nr:Dam family site-specific DNA-(adenine-N6)-methyltransferase [Rahnella aquatilis]
MRTKEIKPFIKWQGGKTRVLPDLLPLLSAGNCLIEPFVGSGAVFMNTNYNRYVLADINPDLIDMYKCAVERTDDFIKLAKHYFINGNTEKSYFENRQLFNSAHATIVKSALFLYLNRHGFNGVCRYSAQGIFNVPYSHCQNKPPYFPEAEIRQFVAKAKATKAVFLCLPFAETIALHMGNDTVIYCDPPYLPVSNTAKFTRYHAGAFLPEHHRQLVDALLKANAKHGARAVISSSDTPLAREIYSLFQLTPISVRRSSGAAAATRKNAPELIGVLPVCNDCNRHGGGNCPECGPVMGNATYQEMVVERKPAENGR